MADITVYKMSAKTGGGVSAADGIDGDDLLDGDVVFVLSTPADDAFHAYVVDDDLAASEKDPDILVPDTNPGNIGLRLMRNIPTPISITSTASGTIVVDSFPDTLGKYAKWDYCISKGTHIRGGTITGVWDSGSTSVQYEDSGTEDVGDTTDVAGFTMTNASSTVELKIVAASTGWTIDTLRIRI